LERERERKETAEFTGFKFAYIEERKLGNVFSTNNTNLGDFLFNSFAGDAPALSLLLTGWVF
jgi:hypothetical protein